MCPTLNRSYFKLLPICLWPNDNLALSPVPDNAGEGAGKYDGVDEMLMRIKSPS